MKRKKQLTKQDEVAYDDNDHSECLKILSLVLDEEATDEQKAYFRSHIENCLPYYEIYHVDKKIKELIKTNCCDKEVPSDLVKSIKLKISETNL